MSDFQIIILLLVLLISLVVIIGYYVFYLIFRLDQIETYRYETYQRKEKIKCEKEDTKNCFDDFC